MPDGILGFLSEVDVSAVLTAAVTFIALILLRLLLDLRLAQYLVRWFHWTKLRNFFRERPPELKGTWELVWEHGGSDQFADVVTRHSQNQMWQLGSYCYGEFYADGIKYGMFGRILDNYFIGDWFAVKDRHGYFGVYHLEIVDSNTLRGKWLGHSKTTREVRVDAFNSRRVDR